MASLVIGTGLFLHSKVQNKKEAKREKKRLEYEARFRELEQDQANYEQDKSRTQHPVPAKEGPRRSESTSEGQREDAGERKVSSESQRRDNSDSPARWVDEVVRERSKAQGASPTIQRG
jgi:hypothetical protein